MSDVNYEDPQVEKDWVSARRMETVEYLFSQNVRHGRIGDWPAWHIAPITSIWAIESRKRTGSVGWWAICGDHPTDYVSSEKIKHPRGALRTFCTQWKDVADHMLREELHPTIMMGNPSNWNELSKLLLTRIEVFEKWASDDDNWDYDEAEFEICSDRR